MKILVVIDSLGSGGAQRQKINLAIGFSKKGYDVDIFTYYKNEFFKIEDDFNKVKLLYGNRYSFELNKGFSLGILLSLRKIILNNGYDLIISSLHTPSIYACFSKIGIKKGRLFICEESSSYAPVNKIKKFFFYISCILSDKVIANSYNEIDLMRRLPFLKNKLTPIWNGYFINDFNKNFNVKKLKKILIVGRVAYPKNGVNILLALDLFYKRNGWLPKIYWAGRMDNDKKSKIMQAKMHSILNSHKFIRDNWEWLGEVKDIKNQYENSDLLLHASLYEGLPNVICEAMLSGLLVIASNVCDHPLLLGENYERGILCNPNKPESICSSLEKANSMEMDLKLKIIQDAHSFALQNLNNDLMIERFIKLIKN